MDAARALSEARRLKAARRWEEADRLLGEALAGDPDHPALRASLADLRLRQERFGEAEAIADSLLSTRPRDDRALVVKGNVAMSESRFDAAAAAFDDAARARPGEAGDYARGRLVTALSAMRRFEDAKRVCREVLVRRGDDPSWLKRLALVYRREGDRARSANLFRRVLAADPGDRFSLAELVQLGSEGRTPSEMDAELSSLLKYAAPGSTELRVLRARLLERDGRIDEARDEYEEALRTGPEVPYLRRMAGFFFHRLRLDARAIELLRPLFLHNPGDAYVRSVVLSILRNAGDRHAVLDLLIEAGARHPNFKPLWGMLRRARREAELPPEAPAPPRRRRARGSATTERGGPGS